MLYDRPLFGEERLDALPFFSLEEAELRQKHIICLGLIAQHESITATDLIKILNLKDREELTPWLDYLVDKGIVETYGSHKSKEYRVGAAILKQSDYKGPTSLKRIENYRIRELIIEDLKLYECSSLKDIRKRIGDEIPYKRVLEQMKELVSEGLVKVIGENRWVEYQLKNH